MQENKPVEKAVVLKEWIDSYGHMNMACYVRVLDDLGHRILDQFGLGAGYTATYDRGLFTVEANLKYLKEVREGDPLRVELIPLRFDDKRLVTRVELYHDQAGYLSAVMDQTAVNVDLATRKACLFDESTLEHLRSMMDAYDRW